MIDKTGLLYHSGVGRDLVNLWGPIVTWSEASWSSSLASSSTGVTSTEVSPALWHHLEGVEVLQPHQVLSSPHSIFREKLPLKKSSVLGKKHFALGSEIEGVPNYLLWVTYEGTLFCFGFQVFRLKLFDISITSPNFKKRQLWSFAIPQFVWCRLNGFWWCPI